MYNLNKVSYCHSLDIFTPASKSSISIEYCRLICYTRCIIWLSEIDKRSDSENQERHICQFILHRGRLVRREANQLRDHENYCDPSFNDFQSSLSLSIRRSSPFAPSLFRFSPSPFPLRTTLDISQCFPTLCESAARQLITLIVFGWLICLEAAM